MISDRFSKLQAKLDSAENIPADTRAELDQLIAHLKAEIDALPDTEKGKPVEVEREDTLQGNLDDLSASVGEFEASHPQLTASMQRLANILSNMGI